MNKQLMNLFPASNKISRRTHGLIYINPAIIESKTESIFDIDSKKHSKFKQANGNVKRGNFH